MREMRVRSLGQEDPLEKETATVSNILAWEILWTEEPGRLHTVCSIARVGHDLTKRQQRREMAEGRRSRRGGARASGLAA